MTKPSIFNAYFQEHCKRRDAFTPAAQIELLDELRERAVTMGQVPIAVDKIAQVPPDDERVQAIVAGREVSVAGKALQDDSLAGKLSTLPEAQKFAILIGFFLAVVLGVVGLLYLINRSQAAAAAIKPTTTITSTASLTATETEEPDDIAPSATPYSVVLDSARVPEGDYDPVSIEFSGQTFVLRVSDLEDGAWSPGVAEWLADTALRRVVAVPYSQQVGDAVARMTFDDPIYLRLNSGEVVEYRLVEIERLKRHQIEVFSVPRPSLVVVLHGEKSSERWVLVADAVQSGLVAPPVPSVVAPPVSPTQTITPTITPTPTQTLTPTPDLGFTPPAPLTEVFIPGRTGEASDTLTLENAEAGLRLEIGDCNRVKNVGDRTGNFLVCDVTLTALQPNTTYSGQSLAITEHSQVTQNPGWWPPPLAVMGGIGDGVLAQVGDQVSGKVAGEVAKAALSDPVFLWEQAGLRFVVEGIE